MPDHLYRQYLRVRLCQIFTGWTLEYADSVIANERDLYAILAIITGQNKAAEHKREQMQNRIRR